MSLQAFLQELLSSRTPLQLIFIASTFTTVAYLALRSFTKRPNDGIPLYTPQGDYKKRWSYDNPHALQEAYGRNRNSLFKIWTSQGYQLALPARYLDELKMQPDTKFPSALQNFFIGPYLWPVEKWKLDYVHKGLHKDLNKHLPSMFLDAKDGANELIPVEFPECKEWTPIKVHPTVLKLVSKINTKLLIGNGLEKNKEWIDISASYTKNIFLSSAKLRVFHPLLRPVAQFFIAELRDVWRCNSRAKELLAPILAEKQLKERGQDYKKPVDSIEWIRDDASDPKDKNDPHLHAILQLILGALSVNTTSQLITNCIYNLATYPEYASLLRDESKEMLTQAGGEWTMDSMGKLEKTDSFIKETLRHAGHLTLTFQRQAKKTITLKDGTQIPEGATVFFPTVAANFDADLYPNPETFDGLRFYKLRHASPENEKKFQLTSISAEQMQFGMGRHACPGRAIASHQVKLILAHLLEKYDFRLKDGEGRPKTVLFQTNQFPDPQGEILFRNRR
ncbi:cytochrome P450 [Bimuria novae-zelandiae CBS 107.79]|uniref:Cytochrome P450 n=1 Tax=Bimuria novae-zelandiae CBS 107.79 TaxID=1447943 RepID=A0A6A5VC88_9PLEO|nr:cytochrome P450 [Bimuria novae-zelandiae CBS 107.79]